MPHDDTSRSVLIGDAIQKVGLSYDSILGYARKAINLLQAHGDDGLDLVDLGFRAFMAFRSHDYLTLLSALNDANKTATTIIKAIKEQFDI